jgi:ATP-dependent DNA helicase RecQ
MLQTNSLVPLLQQKFQFQDLRPGQLEVIQAILSGQDVLCVMPTGYGKSLCYQLSSLLLDGVTVVVSPLVALMKDQVDSLHARGFKEATFINSSVKIEEQQARLRALKAGQFRLKKHAFRNKQLIVINKKSAV